VGVQEHTASFLDYLDQLNLSLGVEIEVIDFFEYDESIKILLNQKETILSQKVSQNLFVQKG
jgi:DtxR family Mn-dependent transcriptional regulator